MDMAIERLTECIGQAVHQAEFTNVLKQRFDSSVMHKLYARKMRREYSLFNTDTISVRETELTDLVSELTPMVAHYTSPETCAIGNGLYKLRGVAGFAAPALRQGLREGTGSRGCSSGSRTSRGFVRRVG